MSIANYGELKTAVADWINRKNLTARIPDFIAMGETDIFRGVRTVTGNISLRCRDNIESLAVAIIVDRAAMPSDYRELITANYDDKPLKIISNQFYSTLRPRIGTPTMMAALNDTWQLWPTPDSSDDSSGTSVELVDGQTVVSFTLPVTGADFYLSGAFVDNRLLVSGTDYAQVIGSNSITLTTSYPEGSIVTQALTAQTIDDEIQTLGDGQITVTFTTNITSAVFYLSGSFVDAGRMNAGDDYTITGDSEITLVNSYPLGTKVIASPQYLSVFAGGQLNINYFADYRGTLVEDADTNPVLTAIPELYLYAALSKAEPFLKNDKRIGLWKAEFESAIRACNATYRRSIYSGGTMAQRTQYRETHVTRAYKHR